MPSEWLDCFPVHVYAREQKVIAEMTTPVMPRYSRGEKDGMIKALFSIPQSIKTRVEAEAYWSRRTQSAVVEQALREALDRAEAEREAREATGT